MHALTLTFPLGHPSQVELILQDTGLVASVRPARRKSGAKRPVLGHGLTDA